MKLYSIPKIVLTNNKIEEDKIVYVDREQARIIFNRYRIYKDKKDEKYVPVRFNYVVTLPNKDHFIHQKDNFVFSNVVSKKDVCIFTALTNDFNNRFGKYKWKFDTTRLFLRFVRMEKDVLNVYFVYYISGNEQIDSDFEYEISTVEETNKKFNKNYVDLLTGGM